MLYGPFPILRWQLFGGLPMMLLAGIMLLLLAVPAALRLRCSGADVSGRARALAVEKRRDGYRDLTLAYEAGCEAQSRHSSATVARYWRRM